MFWTQLCISIVYKKLTQEKGLGLKLAKVSSVKCVHFSLESENVGKKTIYNLSGLIRLIKGLNKRLIINVKNN